MPAVELVYAPDCPNVARARRHLIAAFARTGVSARWLELRLDASDLPAHARGYGSPTILVDGRDVAHESATAASACRIYTTSEGLGGAPPIEQIVRALGDVGGRAVRVRAPDPRWQGLAMLPGIGAAFLPKIACPACWPAYAGVLGSLGLGFLMDTTWLLPLTAVFLGLAIGALAFRARRRRGFRPMILGTFAAAIVLAGKFGFESDAAMYVGLAILVGASLWNTWPRKQVISCSACVRAEVKGK